MNFNDIDFKKINITKKDNNFHTLTYDNNKFILKLNNVQVPYGLENEYGKLTLKLNISDNDIIKHIINIEEIIIKKFKLNIKSQLRNNSLLTCRIPTIKNKIICDIKKNNSYYNIYKLKRNDFIDCLIFIDKIWLYNNNYYYKWNFKEILLS